MLEKLASLLTAGLLLIASLASLLFFAGCLGPDAPNDSERPHSEPGTGSPFHSNTER